MKYTEATFIISPVDPYRDLLIDALGNEGPYDSFVETPDGLKAYVPTDQFDPEWLQGQINALKQNSSFNYQLSIQAMPDINWNEEWEKQHTPVLVTASNGLSVWIRAPFHPHRPESDFGTAHHPTTYMMLSFLAELPLLNKLVLDMGCGTAVLAILAKIRGAEYVEAIDIDEWAYNNALENANRNHADITVRVGDADLLRHRQPNDKPFDLVIANINRNILLHDLDAYASVLAPGDASLLQMGSYDVILANIHRNILLEDMPTYVRSLRHGGRLLLSGFYQTDTPALQQKALEFGLQLSDTKTREGWCALRFNA